MIHIKAVEIGDHIPFITHGLKVLFRLGNTTRGVFTTGLCLPIHAHFFDEWVRLKEKGGQVLV